MTALSADTTRDSKHLGTIWSLPAGVDIFYEGALVMINAAGYAMPAQAEASNAGCVGVCLEQVDNSGGSAGDKTVLVQEGTFKFAGDTLQQEDVGGLVYADDDNTIDETQAANAPVAGILVEYVDASTGWVQVSMSNSKHA